ARVDAQQRADLLGAQRTLEDEHTAASGRRTAAPRKTARWGRTVAISAVLLLLIAVAAIQIVPVTGYIPAVERLISERVQQPVSIGGLRFTLFPTPQLKIERMSIGKGQEARIDATLIPITLGTIFDDKKQFDEVELANFTVEQDAIPQLASWIQAPANAKLNVRRLKITGIKLGLQGVELPNLDATVVLAKDGGWQKLSLRDLKANLEFIPLKEPGQYRANLTARAWTLPVGPRIEFAELNASAIVTREQLVVSAMEGQVFGGSFKGAVTVQWKSNLAASGEVTLKAADLSAVLAGFTRDLNATGTMDTALKFYAQGQTVDDLFAAPRVSGTFALQKGTLNNIDLVRGIQSTSRSGLRGGRTPYTEISGDVQSADGRIAYRNIKLAAGPLNATGGVDVMPAGQLGGRLNVQLGTATTTIARGALNIGGDTKAPLLGP
ncbi:MAG TPA: AsmA-like C-terminal region-containing protein, partial [Burkholderiales bacterium]|nr:AsmA-like C-terminal region-containing protein [Burkholderiales bacterium]